MLVGLLSILLSILSTDEADSTLFKPCLGTDRLRRGDLRFYCDLLPMKVPLTNSELVTLELGLSGFRHSPLLYVLALARGGLVMMPYFSKALVLIIYLFAI